ncbi:MAG TPA: hypothetical protein VJQ61_03170 [Sinomonas sp.]|nr:hypothetical protein [Sinomonas sp.]
MIFEIMGPTGTENVHLGMSKNVLRRSLGNFREFRRAPTSPPSDQFLAAGLMATYDPQDRVVLIEFAEPASPRLVGLALLGLSTDRLGDLLSKIGLASTAEDDAVLVPSWHMSFYAPDGVVEGVLLGE